MSLDNDHAWLESVPDDLWAKDDQGARDAYRRAMCDGFGPAQAVRLHPTLFCTAWKGIVRPRSAE